VDSQYHARILIFCVLVSAQAGLMVFAAIRYQTEDKVVREVVAGADQLKKQWAAKMAQYDMDPLYEMMNGSRPVTLQELNEMNAHAKGGQAALLELVSEEKQWEEQGFNRIAKVTARGARDFRRGVESRRFDEEEMLKPTQALYSEDEQLTEFLIRLYGHYRVVHEKSAFVFDSNQDAQSFNELREKVTSLYEKEQERIRQVQESP
jgi:hypothetical protein